MRDASNLLYGQRRQGKGLRRPYDITERFFEIAFKESFTVKNYNLQELLAARKNTPYEQLLSLYTEQELVKMLGELLADKDNADLIEHILPRREKLNGKWGIKLCAYWDRVHYEAVIEDVVACGSRLIGTVVFIEVCSDASAEYYTTSLERMNALVVSNQSNTFLRLYDFVEEVAVILENELKAG